MTAAAARCKRFQRSPGSSGADPAARPTLLDVARLAGVSPATVSRALARPDVVRAATRERITETVRALGYRPNHGARSLAGDRWDAIGVIVPDITNPFFAALVRGASAAAAQHGKVCLLAETGGGATAEVDVVASLAARVDGLVVAASTAPASDLQRAAGGRAVVLVNRRATGLAAVIIDQRAIVTLGLRHLRDLGHRRIAVASGPSGSWSSRRRRDALAEHADLDLVVLPPGSATAGDGPTILDAVREARASALLAFNDVQALAVLAECRRRGIDVPGALSVVGVDDVPMSSLVDPALTTVAAPATEAGATAAILLVPGANVPPRPLTLAPRLVVRDSTGPAAPPR
ncbi:LacI family transcriptional regulator, partial [Candidatus Binatia bacterium]|nr:LacI family transcriptional regulator [Candidatus Binatia bacterium]